MLLNKIASVICQGCTKCYLSRSYRKNVWAVQPSGWHRTPHWHGLPQVHHVAMCGGLLLVWQEQFAPWAWVVVYMQLVHVPLTVPFTCGTDSNVDSMIVRAYKCIVNRTQQPNLESRASRPQHLSIVSTHMHLCLRTTTTCRKLRSGALNMRLQCM